MQEEEADVSSDDVGMRTASGVSSTAGSEHDDRKESPSDGRRYKLRRRSAIQSYKEPDADDDIFM